MSQKIVKSFYSIRNNQQNEKAAYRMGRKMFAVHISDIALILEIYRQHLHISSINKTNLPIKMYKRHK
jgi:hypothetical protein